MREERERERERGGERRERRGERDREFLFWLPRLYGGAKVGLALVG